MVNQAKVLSKKNTKMLRKRPRAPKYVRHFVRLISELAEEHDGAVEFGPVVVKIWAILLKYDKKGQKHLKDEEKIRRSKEKERRKKEKRRARKRSERERKSKKKKSPDLGGGVIGALIAHQPWIRRLGPPLMIVGIRIAPAVGTEKTGEVEVLSGDPGLASSSFDASMGRSTSACGMASGKIALDHRVKSAGTVERDTGHSSSRSSVADDMQARGGGGGSAMRRR